MKRTLCLLVGLALAGTLPAWGQGLTVSSLSPPATQGDIMAMMPVPATVTPPAAALDGVTGASSQYARADHTHAVRVQRTVLVTAADGTATWAFLRPVSVPSGRLPVVAYMVEDQGTPVVVQIVGRTMTSDTTTGVDTHTAVAIRAQRSRTLPAVLLSLATIVNYDVFGGAASGVKVNLWVADPTQ